MIPEEIQQFIATYNEYLGRMIDAARHFCEDLLESNYREVSEVLPALVSGMEWINEAMENFVFLGRVPESQLISFRDMLSTMHGALENRDYVLLHDFMEYELIPQLESIKINQSDVN